MKCRWIVATVALLALQTQGFAVSTDWIGGQSGNDMTVPGNWSSGAPTDVAVFQTGTSTPTLSSAETLTVNTFQFTGESFNVNLTDPVTILNLQGTGVEVDTNQPQIFTIQNGATLNFNNASSAYTGTGTTPPIYNINNGVVVINNNSTMGSAVFNVGGPSGQLYYYTSDTTGNAAVTLFSGGYFEIDTSGNPAVIGSLAGDASVETELYDDLNAGVNNTSTTYAGEIRFHGGAAFNKVGTGTFTFSGSTVGNNGTINVLDGGFVLDGTITTIPLNTAAGTILSGTGVVLNSSGVTVGGTISPGDNNDIGTLTFANTPYLQFTDSTYLAKVNGSGASDLINVIGNNATATIDSGTTLSIASNDGTYSFNHLYTLLHADLGITGTYSNVVTASPFLVPHVAYVNGPTDLVLNLTTDFTTFADPDNRCLATVLDTLSNDTPTTSEDLLLSALVGLPNAGSLNDALHQLSGLPYTYVTQLSQYTDFRFNRRLFNAVREWIGVCNCCPSHQLWVRGEYDHADTYGRKNNHFKLHDNSWDISAGLQVIRSNLVIGLAGNYSSDNVRFTYNRRSNELQTGQGALYALYQTSQFYVFSDLIIGNTWANHFKRRVHFSSLDTEVRSNLNIFHGKYYAEAGWVGCFRNFMIEPFIGGDAGWYDRHKIYEHGEEALNRYIHRKSNGYGDVYVGSHFLVPLCQFSLSGDLYYQHRFGSFDNRVDTAFRGFGDLCSVASKEFGRNGVVGTLNISSCVTDCFEVYVELNGQGWERFASYGASLGLALSF